MRVLLGLIKGAIIGGGLGFGFTQLGPVAQHRIMQYVLYAAIGALVGFIAGKPFWRHDTIWTPIIKAFFGAAVSVGLYVLVVKVLGDPKLAFIGPNVTATTYPYVLGGAIGGLWGIFVEVDDGGKAAEKEKAAAKSAPKKD